MNPTHCSEQINGSEDVFQSAMHTFSNTHELFQAGHWFIQTCPISEEDPPLLLLCQSQGWFTSQVPLDWLRAHSYYASS